jgi:hypothetical protein
MRPLFLLAVALIVAELPPAFALNCTLYEGEQGELCGIVNPLEVNEDEKEALMQPSIYGESDFISQPVNLNLNLQNERILTPDELYEKNILRVWNILLITFIHYIAYSVSTKSSSIIKWLRVDSLT